MERRGGGGGKGIVVKKVSFFHRKNEREWCFFFLETKGNRTLKGGETSPKRNRIIGGSLGGVQEKRFRRTHGPPYFKKGPKRRREKYISSNPKMAS